MGPSSAPLANVAVMNAPSCAIQVKASRYPPVRLRKTAPVSDSPKRRGDAEGKRTDATFAALSRVAEYCIGVQLAPAASRPTICAAITFTMVIDGKIIAYPMSGRSVGAMRVE